MFSSSFLLTKTREVQYVKKYIIAFLSAEWWRNFMNIYLHSCMHVMLQFLYHLYLSNFLKTNSAFLCKCYSSIFLLPSGKAIIEEKNSRKVYVNLAPWMVAHSAAGPRWMFKKRNSRHDVYVICHEKWHAVSYLTCDATVNMECLNIALLQFLRPVFFFFVFPFLAYLLGRSVILSVVSVILLRFTCVRICISSYHPT